MTLVDLGLDHGWASEAVERCGPDSSISRVTAVDRGRYLIRGEGDEVPAELTGKFLHLAESAVEMPCVGDWVCVQYRDGGTQPSIHHVLPCSPAGNATPKAAMSFRSCATATPV